MGRDQSGRNGYKTEYNRANYDRVIASLPKGKRVDLQAYARQAGTSVNAVIIAALEQYTGLDLSDKD